MGSPQVDTNDVHVVFSEEPNRIIQYSGLFLNPALWIQDDSTDVTYMPFLVYIFSQVQSHKLKLIQRAIQRSSPLPMKQSPKNTSRF